jgi:hypothetical protein
VTLPSRSSAPTQSLLAPSTSAGDGCRSERDGRPRIAQDLVPRADGAEPSRVARARRGVRSKSGRIFPLSPVPRDTRRSPSARASAWIPRAHSPWQGELLPHGLRRARLQAMPGNGERRPRSTGPAAFSARRGASAPCQS